MAFGRKSSQGLIDADYHRLDAANTSNSSRSLASMRNWPLFLFLSALVFFFYVFYVYQAASAELALVRAQLDLQVKQVRQQRKDAIDLNADLEKERENSKLLRSQMVSSESKLQECVTSLRAVQLRQASLTDEKTAADAAAKERLEDADHTRAKMAELQSKWESLQMAYDNKMKEMDKMHADMALMQKELGSKGIGMDAGGNSNRSSTKASNASGDVIGVPAPAVADGQAASDVTTTATAVASADRQVWTSVAAAPPADLGELIKQEDTADKAPEKPDSAGDANQAAAAVENGEKPAPDDKKADGGSDVAVDAAAAAEDAVEDRDNAVMAPGRAGDRVKMEEGLLEDKKQGDDGMDAADFADKP